MDLLILLLYFSSGFLFHYVVEMIVMNIFLRKKKLFFKIGNRWYPINPYRHGENGK